MRQHGLAGTGFPDDGRERNCCDAVIKKRTEYVSAPSICSWPKTDGDCSADISSSSMREREQGVPRLGVTVTKKIGHAVTRNRLKRVCREYFRTHRDQLAAAFDVHVIARSGSAQAANDELTKSLEKLFSQIE